MNRFCYCNNVKLNQEYTLDQCRLCWLYYNEKPKLIPLDCIHLGDVIDKLECNCPNKWIRSCEIYNKCTLGDINYKNSCVNCSSYKEKTPEYISRERIFLTENSFNPTIYKDKLIYRKNSTLYKKNGEAVFLGQLVEDCLGQEDARFFTFNNKLYISYNGLSQIDNRLTIVPCIAELDEELNVISCNYYYYLDRMFIEKNWTFFEYKKCLYCVYKINPHIILKVGPSGRLTKQHEVPFNYKTELRGGAAPVLVDREFWCFCHDTSYKTRLYTFAASPPFKPLRVSKTPIINFSRINYVCGAQLLGNIWELSYGLDDKFCEIIKFEHEELESYLTTI